MSLADDFLNALTGTVFDFAGTAQPTGFLWCNGAAVNRTTYARLFAVIGTTYGTGDGSTTFNMPDLRGRVVSGKDNMGGSAATRMTSGGGGVDGTTLGATGGTETHTLTTAQMPAHNHGVTDPGHTHGHNAAIHSTQGSSGTGGAAIFSIDGAATINSATTGISTQNNGSGSAHNNMQPTFVLNKIIKT